MKPPRTYMTRHQRVKCDGCAKVKDCWPLRGERLCPECHAHKLDSDPAPLADTARWNWGKLTDLNREQFVSLQILAKRVRRLDDIKESHSQHAEQLAELFASTDDASVLLREVETAHKLSGEIDHLDEVVTLSLAAVKQAWVNWKLSRGEYEGMTEDEHAEWQLNPDEIVEWAESAFNPQYLGRRRKTICSLQDGFVHWLTVAVPEVEARKQRNTDRMRKSRADDKRRSKDAERKRESRAADKVAKVAKADERRLKDKLRKRAKVVAEKAKN